MREWGLDVRLLKTKTGESKMFKKLKKTKGLHPRRTDRRSGHPGHPWPLCWFVSTSATLTAQREAGTDFSDSYGFDGSKCRARYC